MFDDNMTGAMQRAVILPLFAGVDERFVSIGVSMNRLISCDRQRSPVTSEANRSIEAAEETHK